MSRKYSEKHIYHCIRIGSTGCVVAGVIIGVLLMILIDLVSAIARYL